MYPPRLKTQQPVLPKIKLNSNHVTENIVENLGLGCCIWLTLLAISNILTDVSFEDDMVDPADSPPVTGAVAGVAGEAAATAVPVG